LSSYPAGGYVAAVADKDTAGLTITGQSAQTESGSTLTIKGGTNAAITAETLTATGAAGLGNFSFTPTVTGAYVMTVWNDQNADGVVNVTEAVQTISLTITAAATLATTLSTAFMTEPSANGATASSTTNAIARSAYKTVNTGIAQIKVT
jgi:hypothetical protein